jgi:hypothetical protein
LGAACEVGGNCRAQGNRKTLPTGRGERAKKEKERADASSHPPKGTTPMTRNTTSTEGPTIDDMYAQIAAAEKAKNFADAQHQQLIAAFKLYLQGKAGGKEVAIGLNDPGAVKEG